MTPPASVDRNVFAMTDEEMRTLGIEQLPQTLGEAIDAFEAAPLAENCLEIIFTPSIWKQRVRSGRSSGRK